MPDIFEINLHPRAHPILSTVSLTLYVIRRCSVRLVISSSFSVQHATTFLQAAFYAYRLGYTLYRSCRDLPRNGIWLRGVNSPP